MAQRNLSSCSLLQYYSISQGAAELALQECKEVTFNGVRKKLREEVALKEIVEFLFSMHAKVRPDHPDKEMIL